MSSTPQNVIFIGLRGSGKSAVARRLAELLGFEAVDTDDLIEQRAGHTIREIFETDGETAFRNLETETLDALTRRSGQVISVGGGAILTEHNRQLLRQAGTCIWLTATPEELHRRVQTDARTATQRPALTELSGLEEIRQLAQTREPLYRATAHHVVDTTGRNLDEVTKAVARRLSSESRAPEGA